MAASMLPPPQSPLGTRGLAGATIFKWEGPAAELPASKSFGGLQSVKDLKDLNLFTTHSGLGNGDQQVPIGDQSKRELYRALPPMLSDDVDIPSSPLMLGLMPQSPVPVSPVKPPRNEAIGSSDLPKGGLPSPSDYLQAGTMPSHHDRPSAGALDLGFAPAPRSFGGLQEAGPTIYGGRVTDGQQAREYGARSFDATGRSVPPPKSCGGLPEAGPTIYNGQAQDQGRSLVAVVAGRSLSPTGQDISSAALHNLAGGRRLDHRDDEAHQDVLRSPSEVFANALGAVDHEAGPTIMNLRQPAGPCVEAGPTIMNFRQPAGPCVEVPPPRVRIMSDEDRAAEGGMGDEAERQSLVDEIRQLDERLAVLQPLAQHLRAERGAANEELLKKVRDLEVFLLPLRG